MSQSTLTKPSATGATVFDYVRTIGLDPADDVVVLVGIVPSDASEALRLLAVPFVVVADPDNDPITAVPGARAVFQTRYRAGPGTLLRLPLPDRVRAVMCFTEFGLLPAAMLGAALGVPAVPVATVLRTRDKYLMRRLLGDAVAQPAYGIVGTDRPVDDQFPVVLKPADGTGSRGVELVSDCATYLLREAEVPGYLWESFVEGREFSVESVSRGGEHHILCITEKITTGAPRFIETGHNVPADLSPDTTEAIERCVRTVLSALGMDNLAAHTEVLVTDERVILVETHTRPGGDRIPLLVKLITGLDQYELAIRALLEPDAPWPAGTPTGAVASVRYLPWENVLLDGVDGLADSAAVPGVVEAKVLVPPGTHIPAWGVSRQRPAYVVAYADDRPELEQRQQAAQKLMAPRFHGA